jgi:hypothetical protein
MQLPPLPDQPPIINGMWAAYIGVIATILIGIFFTKDDKRNLENILSNLVSFCLLLGTIQFTWLILLFMGFYLFGGVIVAIEKMRKWFFLFGSKTYGSLSLVLLLIYDNRLPLGIKLHEIDFPVTAIVFEKIFYLIGSWFILAIVAHIVGWLYWRRPSSKKSGSSSKGGSKSKGKAAEMKAALVNLMSSREQKKRTGHRGKKKASGRR